MDFNYLIFGILVFAAVILLVIGVSLYLQSNGGLKAKRIKRRLLNIPQTEVLEKSETEISIRKTRVLSKTPVLQDFLSKVPLSESVDKLLAQSGMTLNVAQFCFYSILTCAGAILILMFFPIPLVISLVIGVAAFALPYLYVQRKKSKRIEMFDSQLPDALDMMSRALRAGHALPSAMKMVGDEMPNPIGGEFRITFDEINYGGAVPEALKSMMSRVPSIDLGCFIVATLIQRETGGNLTELLSKIAHIVRERIKLAGEIRTLTAEGRISAKILIALPFCVAGMLMLVNAELMSLLWTTPAGVKMLITTLIVMGLGIIWMRKLIRIRV